MSYYNGDVQMNISSMKMRPKVSIESRFGLIMWMLVIFMFLVVLPQILPPSLPPPPSLLLFVPVIIMVILLHFALFTSSEVPITTDVIQY